MSPLFGRPREEDDDPPMTTLPDAPTYGARAEAPPSDAEARPAPQADLSGDDDAMSDEQLDAASAAGAAAVGQTGGGVAVTDPAEPEPEAPTAGTLPPNTPIAGTTVQGERPSTMIPARTRRSTVESFFMRIIATCGIVAIGVVIGAIMSSQHVHGWITGLVVATVTVVLSAVLWSSQRL